MRSRRTRFRVLGAALVVYGLAGIVIFVLVALGVARPLERAKQLTDSVETERTALISSLDQAETTIRGMSTSASNLDSSLGDAKTAIDDASTMSHGLAQSMYGLRDAMGVSILGAQPLIGLASGFDTSGQNLDQLGNDITAIGTAIDTNRTDVQTTSGNLTDLADSVGDLTDSIREGPKVTISPATLDSIRYGVYAVTGWLIVFAIGCVLGGLYLIIHTRPRRVVAAASAED
jgi:hypothetical protein